MKVKRSHIVAGLLDAAQRYRDMANDAPHLRDILHAMERDMVRYSAYAQVCDGFEFIEEDDDVSEANV